VLRLSCVHWALRFRSRTTQPRGSPQRALGLSHDRSDSLSSSPPPSLPPPFSGSFLPRRFRAPPLITPVRPLASRTLHSIQLRKRTVLCFSASLSSFVVLLLLLAVRSTQPLACVAPKVGPLCEDNGNRSRVPVPVFQQKLPPLPTHYRPIRRSQPLLRTSNNRQIFRPQISDLPSLRKPTRPQPPSSPTYASSTSQRSLRSLLLRPLLQREGPRDSDGVPICVLDVRTAGVVAAEDGPVEVAYCSGGGGSGGGRGEGREAEEEGEDGGGEEDGEASAEDGQEEDEGKEGEVPAAEEEGAVEPALSGRSSWSERGEKGTRELRVREHWESGRRGSEEGFVVVVCWGGCGSRLEEGRRAGR
jgi:uncharacterized membrane protein YgcG